jgi:hypothetical protein
VTRSVDVVRQYARRGGRPVPVEVRSFADVKFAGVTEFVMNYEYESVDGRPAHEAGPRVLLPRATNLQ